MDKVLDYFLHRAPSPQSSPLRNGDGEPVAPDSSATLSGTVISVVTDPHVGKICLARIHQGTLGPADSVTCTDGKGEKLGGLFRLVGKKRENVESAGPGDIVAFSKVEKMPTWSHFSVAGETPIVMATPTVPKPMVALAVVPKSRADEQKIGEALNKLSAEDPSILVEHTQDTHELVLHGMSDLHLQLLFDRMQRRYGVEVETHLPVIAYRETVSKSSEGHHRHKKQSGGRGQFGECYMRIRPAEEGEGVVFADKVVGGAIPRNLIPAAEKGFREMANSGILTNGQVVDVVHVRLRVHEIDEELDDQDDVILGQRA